MATDGGGGGVVAEVEFPTWIQFFDYDHHPKIEIIRFDPYGIVNPFKNPQPTSHLP